MRRLLVSPTTTRHSIWNECVDYQLYSSILRIFIETFLLVIKRDGKVLILGHKSYLAKIRTHIICSDQDSALYPEKENNQRTK